MLGRTGAQNPRNGARDELGLGVGTGRGATPFWLAASSADIDLMRVLLDGGADPRLTPECQSTPLMVAAGLGQSNFTFINDRTRMLAAVKFLVEVVGTDVNPINEGGFTALHGAAYTGSDAIVQYLVDHGAQMNVQDWRGRTPFRIAQGHKAVTDFFEWPRTAELLRRLGADASLGVDGRIAEREVGRRARDAEKP
jgi:ankyrin repeat protein